MNVKGILFDSGDTLVFPKGGSWWPGPDFHAILQRHGISGSDVSPGKLKLALAEAEKCFDMNRPVVDCEEERDLFKAYYRVV